MSIFKDQFPRIGASGQSTGFTIDQSARFDQVVGAYLQNPNSNAGDSRKKFTFSTWFKRGVISDTTYFFQYVNSYGSDTNAVSYTHLTLPTNREV